MLVLGVLVLSGVAPTESGATLVPGAVPVPGATLVPGAVPVPGATPRERPRPGAAQGPCPSSGSPDRRCAR